MFLPQRFFRQSLSGTPIYSLFKLLYLYVRRCLHIAVFKICLYYRLQSTGADARHLAKMEDAVDKKMLLLSANVLMAGLDATVTSVGSPVKQLLDKEVSFSHVYDLPVVSQQRSIIFSC